MALPSDLELVGRLALAALLGGVIGFEREVRGQSAGLRTHITVAVGSALFVVGGAYGFDEFVVKGGGTNVVVGVDRVASTVVTGIGFLGGGAILKHGATVRGLTTAGSLWVTSAVGLAAALGSYTVVLAATALTLVSLVALRFPERWIQRKWAVDREVLVVRLAPAADTAPVIAALAGLRDVHIRHLMVQSDGDDVVIEAALSAPRGAALAERVAPLAARDDVQSVELT